jgi:hypothetical protein
MERTGKKCFRVEFQGQFSRAFVNSVEGLTMPVFTFEKISPPMRRAPASSSPAEKPRGVLTQLLDRFTEARAKRLNSRDKAAQLRPRKQKSAK